MPVSPGRAGPLVRVELLEEFQVEPVVDKLELPEQLQVELP